MQNLIEKLLRLGAERLVDKCSESQKMIKLSRRKGRR